MFLTYFNKLGKNTLIDTGLQICMGGKLLIGNNSCIDKNCAITALSYNGNKGIIKIGDNVSIGPFAHITSINEIIIGNNIDIGPRCLISDNSKNNTLLN